MTTFIILVQERDYYSFRRWLKALDPQAATTARPAGEDIWRVRATSAKAYLKRMALRRWAAR
jgi:hypothetical protein